MSVVLRTFLVALLGLSLALVPSLANAVGEGDPVIVAPGSTVKSGWAGPVTVDFTNAPTDYYDVYLYCDNGYDDSTSYNYTGNQNVWSWYPSAITGPTTCDLEVSGYDAWTSSSFTVSPPAMAISNVSLSPSTFYPLVKDGYRDTTTIRFRLNQRANVVATVTSRATGRRVRTVDVGWRLKGNRAWSWNGRKNDGTLAKTGYYKVQITAKNSAGSKASVVRTVRVATSTVTTRTTKRKWGDEGAGATSASCYVTKDSYEGSATLDCWGGDYARMTYTIRIPANAFDITWRVSGALSSADICCDGKVTKTGWRAAPRSYKVRAQVTGWRAYDVNRVAVTYSYTRRI